MIQPEWRICAIFHPNVYKPKSAQEITCFAFDVLHPNVHHMGTGVGPRQSNAVHLQGLSEQASIGYTIVIFAGFELAPEPNF